MKRVARLSLTGQLVVSLVAIGLLPMAVVAFISIQSIHRLDPRPAQSASSFDPAPAGNVAAAAEAHSGLKRALTQIWTAAGLSLVGVIAAAGWLSRALSSEPAPATTKWDTDGDVPAAGDAESFRRALLARDAGEWDTFPEETQRSFDEMANITEPAPGNAASATGPDDEASNHAASDFVLPEDLPRSAAPGVSPGDFRDF